jgi:hypothetical protein
LCRIDITKIILIFVFSLMHPITWAQDMLVMSAVEDAGEVTDKDLDLQMLKAIEIRTAEVFRAKMSSALKAQGSTGEPPTFTINSHYVEIEGKKLAVVKLRNQKSINVVSVSGIKGKEYHRVLCVRSENIEQDIPISYGPCAAKIAEVFAIKSLQENLRPTAQIKVNETNKTDRCKPVIAFLQGLPNDPGRTENLGVECIDNVINWKIQVIQKREDGSLSTSAFIENFAKGYSASLLCLSPIVSNYFEKDGRIVLAVSNRVNQQPQLFTISKQWCIQEDALVRQAREQMGSCSTLAAGAKLNAVGKIQGGAVVRDVSCGAGTSKAEKLTVHFDYQNAQPGRVEGFLATLSEPGAIENIKKHLCNEPGRAGVLEFVDFAQAIYFDGKITTTISITQSECAKLISRRQ